MELKGLLSHLENAYQAEQLTGSYLTAPLRTYNRHFHSKIQSSSNAYERTAWKICHVVSSLFAYLTLGLLAVVGIAINLCLIPPQNGYSLWARLNGVPAAAEEFYKELYRDLSYLCELGAESVNGSANSSSDRWYTYHLNKQLSFDIKDIFNASSPSPKIKGPLIEVLEENREILSQQTEVALSPLQLLQPHINHIQKVVRNLSQKHGWHPEKKWITTTQNRATVVIPLPDHIPLPSFDP